jgi:ATP-dependent HslUV protease ATP-binding subunit HslU
MKTENIDLQITDTACERISEVAAYVNDKTENIGARRLHTVMEKLLDELSFNASEINEQNIVIDTVYVDKRLNDLIKDEDLTRYIL